MAKDVKKKLGAGSSLWDATGDDVELAGDATLAFEDRELLGRVARLLVGIVLPKYIRHAVRAGYTKEEHESLWQLFSLAAGRGRPLPAELIIGGGGDDRQRLLFEIDEFENRWFPRTARIIERLVEGENEAETFAAKFFDNLAQQPLGAGVLDSVSTYLDRVDALANVNWPNAKDVLETLRRRGVTVAKTAELRAKIKELRGVPQGHASPSNAADLKQADEAQRAALRQVRLAWNDWATTLRPLYNITEQLQLGLTTPKSRSGGEPDAGSAEAAEGQSAEGAPQAKT